MVKHSKKSKKHKKHKSERHPKQNSSSDEEWVEAESVRKSQSDSSDSPEVVIPKHRNTKSKYRNSSCESSDNDELAHERSNKSSYHNDKSKTLDKEDIRGQREDWMNLPTNFTSFSNRDSSRAKELEKKLQKEQDQYDPRKSSRELNKYWRDGGDGLPKFQRPRDDHEEKQTKYKSSRVSSSVPRWRKSDSGKNSESRGRSESGRRESGKQSDSERRSESGRKSDSESERRSESGRRSEPGRKSESKRRPTPKTDHDPVPSSSKILPESPSIEASSDKPLTQKDLNLLAGKLVKAEIMGNDKLIKELKEKLEQARKSIAETGPEEEGEMLIQSNRQGLAKPLELLSEGDHSRNGKRRKKALETHTDQKRVRYFPDDDKYSLQQMFQNEKYNSASDQDATFMKLASKLHKNDDLDDLFTDDARRKESDLKINEKTRSKTINEHKKVSGSLDNCARCIQSNMPKHLIVSMGEYVYLALPAHEPLLPGHCFIVPIRHVCSVTQLDENEWSEVNDFRKALVRLFDKKEQEPIFFEIAVGFHRYPHMVLECIPMNKSDAALAPMYFKKAIDESETEWSQNKKLVSLSGRSVRQAIPKELAYFAVNFGTNDGFAHVIEDERLFPKNFAQEIIGGILDLDHNVWRKPARQSFDIQSKRVLCFSDEWKNYDCTVN